MSSGKWSAEGYEFMGAAFEVYNELGSGLSEEIYQQSLEIELGLRNIPFTAQQTLPVFYKGRKLLKHYIPDLIVHGGIVVELKAVTTLAPEHEAQLLNYLRISQQSVGYLINFAHAQTLEWKRYIL